MTYRKAAKVILNTWNSFQDFDAEPQEEITGNSGFDIAMKMAYDVLLEKAKENGEASFVSAAVRFVDSETKTILEMTGKRHHEIYKAIRDAGYYDDFCKWHEDGFIIVKNGELSFLNKEEATEYAKELSISTIASDILISEDLW